MFLLARILQAKVDLSLSILENFIIKNFLCLLSLQLGISTGLNKVILRGNVQQQQSKGKKKQTKNQHKPTFDIHKAKQTCKWSDLLK